MKILAVQVMGTGEAYNLPLGEGQVSGTIAIYAGEIGNMRLYGYVSVDEAIGKQPGALSVDKPADVEWGNIRDGAEWCRPPVQVQPEPNRMRKGN